MSDYNLQDRSDYQRLSQRAQELDTERIPSKGLGADIHAALYCKNYGDKEERFHLKSMEKTRPKGVLDRLHYTFSESRKGRFFAARTLYNHKKQ